MNAVRYQCDLCPHSGTEVPDHLSGGTGVHGISQTRDMIAYLPDYSCQSYGDDIAERAHVVFTKRRSSCHAHRCAPVLRSNLCEDERSRVRENIKSPACYLWSSLHRLVAGCSNGSKTRSSLAGRHWPLLTLLSLDDTVQHYCHYPEGLFTLDVGIVHGWNSLWLGHCWARYLGPSCHGAGGLHRFQMPATGYLGHGDIAITTFGLMNRGMRGNLRQVSGELDVLFTELGSMPRRSASLLLLPRGTDV